MGRKARIARPDPEPDFGTISADGTAPTMEQVADAIENPPAEPEPVAEQVAEPEPAPPEPDHQVTAEPANSGGDLEHLLSDIQRKACAVKLQRACYENAKAEAKKEKEDLERLERELEKLCLASEANMPLFDKKPAQATTQESGEPSEDTSWRDAPLAQVLTSMSEKKIELLSDAGLATLGQLTDFQGAKGEYDWNITGIGPETRTKIENDVVAWFDEWRKEQDAKNAPVAETQGDIFANEEDSE